MSSNSKSGAKPKLACEVSADRILAARVADGEGVVSTCAAQELSPGSVIPDLIENNLVRRDSVRAAIQETLASIGILDQEQLLLFRTLENPRGVSVTGEQLAEDVYPSVVFFQDTYHLNIDRIYISGLAESGGAAPALRAQTGAEVRELVSSSQLGSSANNGVPHWRMAGVVGALLS